MHSILITLIFATFTIAAPQYAGPYRPQPLVPQPLIPQPLIPQPLVPQPVVVQPQVRVPTDSKDAVILRYDSDTIGVSGYSYAVETSDGQSKQETGELINPGTENEAIAVRGAYSYVGPDGNVYTVTYIADENGFQPQGLHLPTA